MHQIKNLYIESSFPDKEKGINFQSDVGSFLEEKWQKTLSPWLDEICPSDQIIEIDRLQIEINLDSDDFDLDVWNDLIMKQIKVKIQDELALMKYDINENLSMISSEKSWLIQWMNFWQTGNLSWNAESKEFDELIAVNTIQEHRNEIIKQKERLIKLLTETHFFVRAFLSMEKTAFQQFIYFLYPDRTALMLKETRQVFIASFFKSPTKHAIGNFLSSFLQWIGQDKFSSVDSDTLKEHTIVFIYQYWNQNSYSAKTRNLKPSINRQSFEKFLRHLLDSSKDKLPFAWRQTISGLINIQGQVELTKIDDIKSNKVRVEDKKSADRMFTTKPLRQAEIKKELKQKDHEDITEWQVEDAGVILLHPFIEMLFKEVGIYNDATKGIENPDQAIQMLHYLVYGDLKFHAHRLTTTKYLCILDDNYVLQEVILKKSVLKECDQLLNSVIKHWKALKKTSQEGLRVSFLQRNGILEVMDDRYNLKIERKAFDILLDQLPWNFTKIKFPWMVKPMYVQW